jgi:hypothetical protein
MLPDDKFEDMRLLVIRARYIALATSRAADEARGFARRAPSPWPVDGWIEEASHLVGDVIDKLTQLEEEFDALAEEGKKRWPAPAAAK